MFSDRIYYALSDDNSIFILSPKEEDEEIERKAKAAIKKITGIQKRNIIFKWNTEIILTSNGKPAYGQMGNNLQ